MEVKGLVVGELGVNTYIIAGDGEGVVIDPGAEGERIMAMIEGMGLTIRYIINTHGHFDHTGANGLIKERTGATLAIHREDVELLERAPYQASLFGLSSPPSPGPDLVLKDGDRIRVKDLEMEIIHTPGHTKGSISILVGGVLFTGDTLFAGSVGRTDLPGGSYDDLIRSIRERILPLPEDTLIYPGHGPSTTLGQEKAVNPFLA